MHATSRGCSAMFSKRIPWRVLPGEGEDNLALCGVAPISGWLICPVILRRRDNSSSQIFYFNETLWAGYRRFTLVVAKSWLATANEVFMRRCRSIDGAYLE